MTRKGDRLYGSKEIPPQPVFSVVAELLSFLRYPTPERWPAKEALNWLLPLLVLNWIASIAASSVTLIAIRLLHTQNRLPDVLAKKWWAAVLLAPLLEELMFRAPLRFGKLRISLPIALLVYFFLTVAGMQKLSLPHVYMAVAPAALFYCLLWIEPIREFIHRQWIQIYPYLVWSLTLLFGILHVTNYRLTEISGALWLLVPLLALPQLLSGCFLAFIRVRFGLCYSILFHAAFNGIAVLFAYLLH